MSSVSILSQSNGKRAPNISSIPNNEKISLITSVIRELVPARDLSAYQHPVSRCSTHRRS